MIPDMPLSREELKNLLSAGKRRGHSNRRLARMYRISRNTVRGLLVELELQRDEGHSALPKPRRKLASILDPYLESFDELLERYPDITGVRMLEELQKLGYPGGIAVVRRRLRARRPRPPKKPVIRFETEPGQQGQMDWSPYKLKLADGSRLDVLCFSYILGYSRRHYIDFTLKRDLFTLIRRHVDAFEYFGGVPRECLYDGEKTVILRWEAGLPVFNPRFLQFITHYLCRPVACAPRRPETKGKVERPFQYIESSLLNARTFDSLDDLRAHARWWLANRSDTHVHGTTGRSPLELFLAEEVLRLTPLPLHPYDTAQIVFAVGRSEAVVYFETNRYSIPYANIGQILTLRVTETEVVIYDPLLFRLGSHQRLPDGARLKTELDEHRSLSPELKYGLEPVRASFLTLGEVAEAFLEGLVRTQPKNSGFHARRILELRERYHSHDIHRALCHALRYHAFQASAIERILKARATPRTLEQLRTEPCNAQLRATLPKISQRPLSAYTQAFGLVSTSPQASENLPDGPEEGSVPIAPVEHSTPQQET